MTATNICTTLSHDGRPKYEVDDRLIYKAVKVSQERRKDLLAFMSVRTEL